jgi:hypothetical protein
VCLRPDVLALIDTRRRIASQRITHGAVIKEGVKRLGIHDGRGREQREAIFSQDPGFLGSASTGSETVEPAIHTALAGVIGIEHAVGTIFEFLQEAKAA